MTRPKGFDYPRVKIPNEEHASKGEAKAILEAEAKYYGKTLADFISDLAIAWTKMKKGEWNQYWPLHSPQMIVTASEAPVAQPQKEAEAEEERKRKEEEARRREALKNAARAELLDDL